MHGGGSLGSSMLILALIFGVHITSVLAQPSLSFDEELSDGPVYVVPVDGMIDTGLARYLDRAISDAVRDDAALIIFHMDTFGGLVQAADDIRKSLLNSPIPTLTFIDKNAASAGALISYATDRIVMVPGASIGAATVVSGAGGEAAPDKYQSYMRGLMRSTAEAKGRDPRIAEAMVDESIEIEGISLAGQVLTLSSSEALEFGVADAVLQSIAEVRAELGLSDRPIVSHDATFTERVLRTLGSPAVASILMLMMLGGLYFELQSPGVGFPGAVALVGAALFFAPHYALGMVASWEIILFFIGVALIVIEIFVLPGFGVAGVSGAVLVLGSLLASRIGDIGIKWPSSHEVASAVFTLSATLVLFVILVFSLGRILPRSRRFNRLVLAPELTSATGYTSADTHEDLIGKIGTAVTPLRPAGVADIEDERVDVVSRGDFIPTGSLIRVVNVRGTRVEVRLADNAPSTDDPSVEHGELI